MREGVRIGEISGLVPEGDTIHRMAASLRPRLLGRAVRRLYLRERGDVPEALGREVRSVEARGKHLLIGLEGELNLRVHQGMNGRMRHYAASAAPAGGALPLLIATAQDAFAFPRASQVELFRGKPERSLALARLGPDLLSEAVDLEAVVARASAPRNFGREVGEVLLDQRVAAGIGNVYKSEALFLCEQSPFVPIGSMDRQALQRLDTKAATLMRANIARDRRVTVKLAELRDRPAAPPELWVYRRGGEPCLKCGTPIAMRRQGEAARSTYFCPRCQKVS